MFKIKPYRPLPSVTFKTCCLPILYVTTHCIMSSLLYVCISSNFLSFCACIIRNYTLFEICRGCYFCWLAVAGHELILFCICVTYFTAVSRHYYISYVWLWKHWTIFICLFVAWRSHSDEANRIFCVYAQLLLWMGNVCGHMCTTRFLCCYSPHTTFGWLTALLCCIPSIHRGFMLYSEIW